MAFPGTPAQQHKALIGLVIASLIGALALVGTWQVLHGRESHDRGELSDNTRRPTKAHFAVLDVAGNHPVRRANAARVVLNRNDLDVVGFQGLRRAQYDQIKATAGTSWATYPDTNATAGALSTAIAWRTGAWTLASAHVFTVPGRDGQTRRRPVVLLHSNDSGRYLYVVNVNNPADRRPKAAHPDQSRWRDQATRIETDLVNQLHATKTPVLVVAGANDSADHPHAFYCAFTGGAPVKSVAAGGAGRRGGAPCHPPTGLAADQLYVTKGAKVTARAELSGPSARAASSTTPIAAEVRITPPATAPFRVATLNVLGASHTGPGGNKPKYAPGDKRMAWAVQLLGNHAIDVVGLQEFELSQWRRFTSLTSGAWETYPGNQLGKQATRQSIAWRTDTWTAIARQAIQIPYFNGGMIRMPYVLLQNKQTGGLTYFANFHNPASTPKWGNQTRWRAAGTKLQVQLANELVKTGVPLVMTGDFNDREKYFCPVVQGAPLTAANGGSRGPGACVPPRRAGIDWIFGSYDIGFDGYTKVRNKLVRKTTDHPLVYADATANPVPPQPTITRLATVDVAAGAGATDEATTRVAATRTLLAANAVDLVGFQNMSPTQYTRFREAAGSTWATYPDTDEGFGSGPIASTIAWRTDRWTVEREGLVRLSGRDGVALRRPYVLLINRRSGREAYVVNVDNPSDRAADTDGDPATKPVDQSQWRAQDIAAEAALVNQLGGDGTAVVLLGGINDAASAPATSYCALVAAAPLLTAAAGPGGTGSGSGCTAPALLAADQIYATTGTTLSNYTTLTGPWASRASTTPPVVADALIPPPSP